MSYLVDRLRTCWRRIDPLSIYSEVVPITGKQTVVMTEASALIAEAAAEIERLESELGKKDPWVVANASDLEPRFRTIEHGLCPIWTRDPVEALQFARRRDAELFAAEDEDAWLIMQVPK
jgi:hypothetical protein